MKIDGVDAKGVNVMNLRPPEIAAAWERGDIDATFIWDPVLSKIKGNGKVIATSEDIGTKGFPTFDGLIVNAKWAAQNEAFMVALVKVLAKADADYRPTRRSGRPIRRRSRRWPSGPRPTRRTCRRRWRCTPSRRWPSRSPTWLGGGAAKAMARDRGVPEGTGPHAGGQARLRAPLSPTPM